MYVHLSFGNWCEISLCLWFALFVVRFCLHLCLAFWSSDAFVLFLNTKLCTHTCTYIETYRNVKRTIYIFLLSKLPNYCPRKLLLKIFPFFLQFGFDFQPTIQKPRIAIISSAGPKPARRCVHFSPPPVFRDLPLQNMFAPNASSFLPPTDRWSHPLIRKRRFAVMMRPHRRPLLPAHPSHGSVDLSPQRQFGCLSDSAINCRRVPGGRGCLDTRLLGILAGFPLTVFNVDRGT